MNIKEDIRVLKELVEYYYDEDYEPYEALQGKEIQAIENIIADRERLEKENIELKEKYKKALSDLAEGTHKRIVEGAEDEC